VTDAAAKPKKKTRRKKKPIDPAAETRRVWTRRALIALATCYLVTLWIDGIGSPMPSRLLPRPWVYFAQVSALFAHKKAKNLDFRAEGWSCTERRWEEIDVTPFFPIDADNKENRFQRGLQFYRRNRTVMHALDDFIVGAWNARDARTDGARIGGVRFSLVRTPYPAPGERVARYHREPLATVAADQRQDQYWTPKSRRAARCGYELPPKEENPEEDSHKDAPNASREKDFEP
jgi:hypothetical protein